MKYILINIYIYQKQKKILEISIFLFKAYISLKSWLIVPKGHLSARQCFFYFKGQLSARQLFLILKVSKFI